MHLSAGVNCGDDQTTDDPRRITGRISVWSDDIGVGRDDHDVGCEYDDIDIYFNDVNVDDDHDDACADSNIGRVRRCRGSSRTGSVAREFCPRCKGCEQVTYV